MHDHGHSHGHGGHAHHHHGDLHGRRLALAIALNVVITAAQVIGGLLSGSLALLSDALHNASDVLALVISWIAQRLSKRPYSERHTFGFKRAEIIAAVINTASLLAISALLVIEALQRLGEPVAIDAGWVIALAGLGILVNGGSMLLLARGADENMNLRSAYLHMLADTLTSVAVLVGGVLMWLWQLWWIDSLLSIGIAVYLVYAAWGLLVQTLRVLMQFTPPELELPEIERAVCALPEVDNLHHVHAWQLNDREIHFEAHVELAEDLRLSEVQRVLSQIEALLGEQFGVHHVLLQPEFAAGHDTSLVAGEAECAANGGGCGHSH